MAKIDAITELLINEIESFSKTIEVLKTQTNQLNNIDFSNQTDRINTHFDDNLKQLKNIQTNHLSKLEEIKQKNFKNSRPKSFIVTVLSIFTLSLGNILYTNYLTSQLSIKENERNDLKTHIINFFEDNPKAKKTYDKWNKK